VNKLLNHPEVKLLLSDEHFSVDGTLIEAWASHKSFRPNLNRLRHRRSAVQLKNFKVVAVRGELPKQIRLMIDELKA
jgi:hypothetical protein